MTELQAVFGPELRHKVIQYMLGKYQGDTEWFQREVGKPMSLRELLALVSERYPQEVKRVNQIVLEGLRQADPNGWERRDNIKKAMRDLDIGYAWDLPPGVPGVWSLEQYVPDPKHPTTAAAKDAVEAWLARRAAPILTLAGSTGVGKSHLSDAAGAWLLAKEELVVMRDVAGLMAELYRAVERHEVDERLRAYGMVPWLILDDLGVGATTDWRKDLMDQLINLRWVSARAGLRTMVTTNLKATDLPRRVASRLGDQTLACVVAISAPDYRTRRGK
ncbi:MAG: ATP-binding protein [Chloroflexota bacterium]|nr:ATP-binding protein [Chloroflexota bacterium]